MHRIARFALLVASLVTAVVSTTHAQAASPSDDSGLCYGFSFGAWTPPLDWRGSGHAGSPASVSLPLAPGGRGWAAAPLHPDARGAMLVFPSWWPVGVEVALPGRSLAPGDTVEGRATALVANGATPSSAAVRVWRTPCGERRAAETDGASTAHTAREHIPIGTWRGTSTCITRLAQCGSDSVVYRIAATAGDEDSVSLAARIIGARGERTTRALRCRYDEFSAILSCDAPNGVLRLAVRGDELGGRLTRRDGVDLRYVHVRRAER